MILLGLGLIVKREMRTMARGNCNNMNREMAGKMISDVSGLSETYVAVTKELNATRTTNSYQFVSHR